MAFNLADVLKNVSDSDTGREQIEYIPLNQIRPDPNNFYELTDVPALADNIALCGLQQPIRVRKQADGRYMIVSGHRRRAALDMLVNDGYETFWEAPCIVEQDPVSPALQQLRLIYANANTRKMTSAELSKQAAEVEKLLYQLKEEGYDFPGRMRDHVAEAVSISKTKLARLRVIRENLAEVWKSAYEANDLTESTAYEIARLDPDDQQLLFDVKKRTGASIRYLYSEDVATFSKRIEEIEALTCPQDGTDCINIEGKKDKAARTERYSCMYSCGKCCAECSYLDSCKNSCPKLKDTVRKMKADAKEDARRKREREEEAERPYIERIQALWKRFGEARNIAGKTVHEYYSAASMYYSKADDERVASFELGQAKFSRETILPYSYSFRLSEADRLIAIADLLGCSLDYLFCRTDDPSGCKANVSESDTKPQAPAPEVRPNVWYPVSVEPPVGVPLIILCRSGFVDNATYIGCGSLKDEDFADWSEVKLWCLDPVEADSSEIVSESDTGWKTGLPKIPGKYVVIVQYDETWDPVPEKMDWAGGSWEQFGMPFEFDEVRILGWMPMLEAPAATAPAVNNFCVIGMSPSGLCGAAAVCNAPHTCCLQCEEDCNGRCGWTEVDD